MIREKIIKKYAKGRDVLDVGSSGQSQLGYLWRIIDSVAKELRGIDPYGPFPDSRVIKGNMETYDFGRKFDLIIAGDVIEHVNNQGLFLENCRKHLQPNGYLIITTPNAKWFNVIFKPNPTHVLWHDYYTMRSLITRFGFQIVHFRYYFGNKPQYSIFKRILTLRQGMLFVLQK